MIGKRGLGFGSALMAAMLLLLVGPTLMRAEWEGNVFEQEMDVRRTPDHIEERAPFNMEPLEIVIESKSGQFINAADVRFSWSYEGRVSTEGGYAFTRINQTTMKGTIPGHPGGYTINYRIVAYDEKNTPLTSTQYSYTVVQNGSFSGEFDENVLLDWTPREPGNYRGVTFNITAIDPNVVIARGDLFYTVAIEDQEPVDGVTFFSPSEENGTLEAEIIFYPPGSRVTFRVEVYDTYMNRLVSSSHTYEYPRLPPAQPIYTGFIFVQFRDVARKGTPPADVPLMVRISNETYMHEMMAESGIAYTNRSVYQGSYRVEVTYQEKEYEWVVSVPRPDGSFSFLFEINEKTYAVPYEKEEGASWLGVVGALAVIAMMVLAFLGTGKVRAYYEELARDKKSRRRKDAEERVPRWYDPLLQNEHHKEISVRVGAFLLLSLAGLLWAPFYPWWMVMILAAFVTVLAVKYPYLSLLLMSVLVTASTAYQSREFGWVFLMLSLVAMVGGFFDWRYAYLTFLTVFAAGFGVGFVVPMAAALLISIVMGTVVLVTAGIFLLVIAPSGNFQFISLISSMSHDTSFVTFSRPVPDSWSVVGFANALSSITEVDMDTISTVLTDTLGNMVPLVGLLGWAAAMVIAYLLFMKVEKGKAAKGFDAKIWALRAIPGVVLLVVGVITVLWAGVGFHFLMVFPFLACIPASILAFNARGLGEESLPLLYGVEEVKSSDVGMKISEMVNFRKAQFKDIGGLDEVKREVKNAIMVPLLEPEMAVKYGIKPSKGVMLFGPPGCGKTLMLRAVASDLNVDMIGIKCSDVMSKWYGESENLIDSLFQEAKARSPCILFLDEIDSIAKRRDFYSTDDVTPRILSIMLSEMDGMEAAEGVIIVATTNMPDLVDPALMRPGRFDKVIYIPPPDTRSREEILKIHLKGRFAAKDIDVSGIAKRTEGFSGADLANLVAEASALGLERALETKKPQPITQEDLESVVSDIKPSVSGKTLKMYDKLRHEYERKGKKPSEKGSTDDVEPADTAVKWEE